MEVIVSLALWITHPRDRVDQLQLPVSSKYVAVPRITGADGCSRRQVVRASFAIMVFYRGFAVTSLPRRSGRRGCPTVSTGDKILVVVSEIHHDVGPRHPAACTDGVQQDQRCTLELATDATVIRAELGDITLIDNQSDSRRICCQISVELASPHHAQATRSCHLWTCRD
jgi:hypothetical protein